MRIGSLGAGVAAAGLILATAASSGAGANPPVRAFGAAGARVISPAVRRAGQRRRAFVYAPTSCSGTFNSSKNGYDYFEAMTDPEAANSAAGSDSFVAGYSNEACEEDSSIGGGAFNVIAPMRDVTAAEQSFIGAGNTNAITSDLAFLGAGYENETSGTYAFVGAGEDNLASGSGSFLGAGSVEYASEVGNAAAGGSNAANAVDSFVGAGDENEVSSAGSGSFIGAGGYLSASNGATTPNYITGVDSFIGAGDVNTVSATDSAVVAGGNNTVSGPDASAVAGNNNTVSADDASVLGGYGNSVSEDYGSIASGYGNTVDGTGDSAFIGAGGGNVAGGQNAFIGAGSGNSALGQNSVIGGGNVNSAKGTGASVLGGYDNSAKGEYATVAGGYGNSAAAELDFVAGYHAGATHAGSFVWSDYDSGSKTLADSAANQFLVRASGGVVFYSNEGLTGGVQLTPGSGTWASLSDRNAKTDIAPLDDASILAKVAALPIDSWQYKSEKGVRHVGPMAQDFYAAFGTGVDNRHITSIDEDGVALAAVKAVNAKLDRENRGLRSRLAALEAKVDALTRKN
jgi:hypothetical protein